MTSLLQIYKKIFQWKKIVNWFRFDSTMGMSLWPHFFGPACKLKITYLLVALDLTTNDGDTSGCRVFSNDDVDC